MVLAECDGPQYACSETVPIAAGGFGTWVLDTAGNDIVDYAATSIYEPTGDTLVAIAEGDSAANPMIFVPSRYYDLFRFSEGTVRLHVTKTGVGEARARVALRLGPCGMTASRGFGPLVVR